MITEEKALEIAREANCLTIPKSNGVEVLPPNFTKALNLAAAVALDGVVHSMDINQMWLGCTELIDIANEYHQAAKVEMK